MFNAVVQPVEQIGGLLRCSQRLYCSASYFRKINFAALLKNRSELNHGKPQEGGKVPNQVPLVVFDGEWQIPATPMKRFAVLRFSLENPIVLALLARATFAAEQVSLREPFPLFPAFQLQRGPIGHTFRPKPVRLLDSRQATVFQRLVNSFAG